VKDGEQAQHFEPNPAGLHLKLVIASRDYPFFLPNLKQPKVIIYRDASHPSALLLPVAP
jgi:hypothetical protein